MRSLLKRRSQTSRGCFLGAWQHVVSKHSSSEETSLKTFGKSWKWKSDPSLWPFWNVCLVTTPSISFSSGTTNAYVGTPLFRGEPGVRFGPPVLASFATSFCFNAASCSSKMATLDFDASKAWDAFFSSRVTLQKLL